MRYHTSGCLLCGGDICYSEAAAPQTCALCGTMHEANATCENGHFICDGCHAQAGLEAITQAAMAATGRDPIRIAVDMMASPFVHMHGPEHHFLVAAALLAAYRNAGGDIDIAASLCAAKHRAAQVPGGICGMWGCCGAGVSSGIFVSVITKATPMSTESWSLANQMTSKSLASIAAHGGPRCCKRDSYLAILAAVDFIKERFQINMELNEAVLCTFHSHNATCRQKDCPFYALP